MATDQTTQDPNQPHDPDSQTAERIRNLAIVGKALNETYSDQNQEQGTDFFLAKEALINFRDGIHKLNLDEVSMEGMDALIDLLQKEIDKRMDNQQAMPV
jgi:predicted RNA polymerase sigma factor